MMKNSVFPMFDITFVRPMGLAFIGMNFLVFGTLSMCKKPANHSQTDALC